MNHFTTALCVLLLSPLLCMAQNFRVIKAEYGADTRWTDVADRLRALVRGDGVEFRVDGETLGDPLPGTLKTLRLRYVLQGQERTDNFEDLTYVRLGSPGVTLPGSSQPSRGNSGDRNRPNVRQNNRQAARNQLEIVRAEYGEGQRWTDVTALLRQQLQNQSLRMMVSNTTMGGDPAPAVAKLLRVEYLYQGQRLSAEVPENRELILPVSNMNNGSYGQPLPAFEVLEAYYQANGRRNDVTAVLRNATQNGRVNMRVNNQTMGGDPVPGPRKELVVRYRNAGTEYEAVVREESTLAIPNSNDRQLGPGTGNYAGNGNTSGNSNNAPYAGGSIFGPNSSNSNYPSQTLEIVSARWGAGNRWIDVTEEVRNAVRGDRLSVNAEPQSFFGADPNPRVRKVLQVRYKLSGSAEMQRNANQGSALNLP